MITGVNQLRGSGRQVLLLGKCSGSKEAGIAAALVVLTSSLGKPRPRLARSRQDAQLCTVLQESIGKAANGHWRSILLISSLVQLS